MKILVTGKGGREHALITALNESPGKHEIYAWPAARPFSGSLTRLRSKISTNSSRGWLRQASALCVAGDESLLVTGDGLANLWRQRGHPLLGAAKESAQLEASKEFAKHFLTRHGIPTAGLRSPRRSVMPRPPPAKCPWFYSSTVSPREGRGCLHHAGDGGGVSHTVFVDRAFGPGRMVVEECLTGPELSVFCSIVDGRLPSPDTCARLQAHP